MMSLSHYSRQTFRNWAGNVYERHAHLGMGHTCTQMPAGAEFLSMLLLFVFAICRPKIVFVCDFCCWCRSSQCKCMNRLNAWLELSSLVWFEPPDCAREIACRRAFGGEWKGQAEGLVCHYILCIYIFIIFISYIRSLGIVSSDWAI